MAFERIELNICPAGDMPVFHCSQYDVGRPIIIDLKNGDDAFSPTAGTTFELHCRKVDDNIVTLDTYEVDGNTLTFTSTEQLCACPGDNLCEVAIYLDELCMGTLNFMLHVEPDPLAGGLESESQIHDLYEQVEEITEQVIGDDYYNKTEVDDLLDDKADKSTTYTKTEVDTALNLKADKSTTYTKTETNNLLAGKADASDTYTKAQVDSKLSLKADKATTYTKTQVDDALALKANSADLATVATTGDYDDLLNKPSIPAAQVQSDYAQSDNTKVDYIKNKPDIEGMIADALLEVMPVDTASGPIATFDTELAVPLVNVSCDVVATGGNGTPTTPIPIVGYSQAVITANGDDITIAFGQTVYGGVLDVTNGTLKKTWNCVDLGNINWTYRGPDFPNVFSTMDVSDYKTPTLNALCSIYSYGGIVTGISDVTEDKTFYFYYIPNSSSRYLYIKDTAYTDKSIFTTAVTGQKLAYELDTPVTLTLTSEQIRAIVGTNNVYTDTNGNTTVKFKDSIQHYIDTKVGS